METFNYPEDYLKQKGNIKHCWEVHKKKMRELGEPYVDYNTFYVRLIKYNWSLFKAIHTPRGKRKRSILNKIKRFFKGLFN